MVTHADEAYGGEPKGAPQEVHKVVLLFVLQLPCWRVHSLLDTGSVDGNCDRAIHGVEFGWQALEDQSFCLGQTVQSLDRDCECRIGDEPAAYQASSECAILILRRRQSLRPTSG